MPVLIYAGEEEFELTRALAKLKKELVDPGWESFNFLRLTAATLTEVIDAACSLPFGPGKKLIAVDGCDFFTKKRGKSDEGTKAAASEKAIKQSLEDFDAALKAVSADTYLLFACPYNFDKTLRLSKVVIKHAQLIEFSKPRYYPGGDNPQQETWCQKEAHSFGVTIDEQAISYLLESTEANYRQISQEIEKAAIFLLPQKHISLEVISQLSPHHSHVFTLLDNWAAQRHKQALACLEELLSKQSGLPILALLHTTFSKWVRMKALALRVISQMPVHPGQMRKDLPVAVLAEKIAPQLSQHPFVVKKELERLKDLSVDLLISKRVQLSRLDKMIKTGEMSDRHALTLFLTT